MEADDRALRDSYYLHITRSLGAALRAQSVPLDEPLPERLLELLRRLDEPRGPAPVRRYTDNA
jgi:hypothetical protein